MKTPYYIAVQRAKHAGRRDAALNFPRPGEPISGQLGEYEHNCSSQQLDEAKKFDNRRERMLESVRNRNEVAQIECEDLLDKRKHWGHRGDGQSLFPRWAHILLLIVWVAVELVFNEVAFRPLGLNPIHTAIMVLAVGIFLTVASDFIGRRVKESNWKYKNLALFTALVGVVVVISILIAKSRTDYIAAHELSVASKTSALRPSATQNSPDAAGPASDHGGVWLLFAAMQLGLVLLGATTSYMSYDPLSHQRWRYARAIARRNGTYDQHDSRWGRSASEADQDWATFNALQAAYLGANVKFRSDGIGLHDLATISQKRPPVLSACPSLPEPKGDLPPATPELPDPASLKNGVLRNRYKRSATAKEAK